MTAAQGAALRRVRERLALSQQGFVDFLEAGGLPDRSLSRQRLSEIEKGTADLPVEQWEDVVEALRARGCADTELTGIHPARPALPPALPNTPELRRTQWLALADRLPGSRWWQRLPRLIRQVAGPEWEVIFHQLREQYRLDPSAHLSDVKRRLELGATPQGHGVPDPGDRVALDSDEDTRRATAHSQQPVLFRFRLRNAGTVLWRDRLLYRIGPPVTSDLPFVPGFVPVPTTAPGQTCEIFIPCRAQFHRNLAVISYAMVFPDCTPCLPGRLVLHVDTREPSP